MLQISKKILKTIVPLKMRLMTTPFRRQVKNFSTLSAKQGQFRSMKSWQSIGADGEPIPWITYPAIEYLNQFDFSEERVLEFGSGGSTIWWAGKSKEIVCVEDNKLWYEKVQVHLNRFQNIKCIFTSEKNEYVSVEKFKDFNIMIIDGNHRGACAQEIIKYKPSIVKNCKMIVVDNSDWLPGTVSFLRSELDWIQIDFMGFGPINGYCHATTIFLNPEKRFIRKSLISPIGGVVKRFDYDLSVENHL